MFSTAINIFLETFGYQVPPKHTHTHTHTHSFVVLLQSFYISATLVHVVMFSESDAHTEYF